MSKDTSVQSVETTPVLINLDGTKIALDPTGSRWEIYNRDGKWVASVGTLTQASYIAYKASKDIRFYDPDLAVSSQATRE